jgi:hypothetical protein
MATVDRYMDHPVRELRSTPGGRHHLGHEALAEVIVIRPARPPRTGILGPLVTMARVFASLRHQATPVRSTPRPPSSPVLLPFMPRTPHDAA